MGARFWWVNHSPVCPFSPALGALWFARRRGAGKARTETERNIARVLPGDLFVSASDNAIQAVGVALGVALDSDAPPPAPAGAGYAVAARLAILSAPLSTTEQAARLTAAGGRRLSPLRADGRLHQDLSLSLMPAALVTAVRELLKGELEQLVEATNGLLGRSLGDQAAEAIIQHRSDLQPARRSDLLRARTGLGQFRTNVESLQQGCRVTGLLDRRHLHAVHLKPWALCSDEEKLDGHNGLLLSPHIAQLFERGYVSFSDGGELLLAPELNPAVLRAWHIELLPRREAIPALQRPYLEFHRQEIFAQHGGGRRTHSVAEIVEARTPEYLEPAVVEPAPAWPHAAES